MKLLTKELEKKLPSLYEQDGKGDEAIAYAKFFDPCGSWTWYATEYDPKTREFSEKLYQDPNYDVGGYTGTCRNASGGAGVDYDTRELL